MVIVWFDDLISMECVGDGNGENFTRQFVDARNLLRKFIGRHIPYIHASVRFNTVKGKSR